MALQEQKLTGLKKRQQIERANRTMFVWVAVASVAVSFLLVMAQFLFQKWDYNNRVLAVKSKAENTLTQNIKNAQTLQDNVNALIGSQDLASAKVDPNDTNTKVVLDALPSVNDTVALATSLQQAILSRSGVTIESINVPGQVAAPAGAPAEDSSQPIEVKFTIVISGPYDRIRGAVVDMGRSIRPMKITGINLTGSDTAMRAALEGVSYYQPAKTTSIKNQVVK